MKYLVFTLLVPALASAQCETKYSKLDNPSFHNILFVECDEKSVVLPPKCVGGDEADTSWNFLSERIVKCNVDFEKSLPQPSYMEAICCTQEFINQGLGHDGRTKK